MSQSFDDWWAANYNDLVWVHALYEIARAAWTHQQQEIDRLTRERDELAEILGEYMLGLKVALKRGDMELFNKASGRVVNALQASAGEGEG